MSASFDGRTAEEQARYTLQAIAAGGSGITDLNVLSVVRTLAEAIADVGERLEEEGLARIAAGIHTSTYVTFGFPLLLATRATGLITISRVATGSSQAIPAGTLVRVPGTNRQYATTEEVTLGVGVASVGVGILASAPGTFYNTPGNTITEWVVAPGGATTTLANPTAVRDGTDDETAEQRAARFARWVISIHRATPAAVEYGAGQATVLDGDGNVIERVWSAQLCDAYAVCSAWIWNGNTTAAATLPEQARFDEVGQGASAALVARAQQLVNGYYDPVTGAPVEGYKAAGIVTTVRAATRRVQPVSAVIYMQDGYTLTQVGESIRSAIREVFARQRVGTAVLRLNDLRQAIGLTRGVIDHAFLNPIADVPGYSGVIIVPGAIGLAQG